MKKKAWIITLSKTDNLHFINNNKPVIAILNSRFSLHTVKSHMIIIHDFLFKNIEEEINKGREIKFYETGIAGLVMGVFDSFVMSACISEIIKVKDNSITWKNLNSLKCDQDQSGKMIIEEVKYDVIYESLKPNININNFFLLPISICECTTSVC